MTRNYCSTTDKIKTYTSEHLNIFLVRNKNCAHAVNTYLHAVNTYLQHVFAVRQPIFEKESDVTKVCRSLLHLGLSLMLESKTPLAPEFSGSRAQEGLHYTVSLVMMTPDCATKTGKSFRRWTRSCRRQAPSRLGTARFGDGF